MIDGNVYDFIDKLSYEDHYVIYDGEKYFFMVAKFLKIIKETLFRSFWKYII